MISFKFNQEKHISSAFICVLLLMFFSACSEKINDYYSGIVIDELGRPVEGALVEIDNQDLRTITDKNGFFKIKRTQLFDLTISKEGYISDTIFVADFDYGSYYYSPLITEDSSIVVLSGENISNLRFIKNDIGKPNFFSITDFKFNKNLLFGVWLKNGDKELDGIKIAENELYIFGYSTHFSHRCFMYIINSDTIICGDSYYNLTGIIQKLDSLNLEVNWAGIGIEKYKRWEHECKWSLLTGLQK